METAKAKEPWLGILFNFIYPGLGQLYAGRKARALIIISISVLVSIAAVLGLKLVIQPDFVITQAMATLALVLFIALIPIGIFIIVDGYLCVKKSNTALNVQQNNRTIKILAIIGCIILFVASPGQNLAAYIRNAYIPIKTFKIPTNSMQPTLKPGDRIFVDKKAYEKNVPKRWDLIVFDYPEDKSKSFIQRIAGLPGEIIEIKDGKIIANGLQIKRQTFYYNQGPYGKSQITVPQNNYFTLGDNSASSRDGRYIGFVPAKNIVGKVTKIYWPPERSGKIK